ncbi:MAG: hypothetical protein KDH95_04075, partial [Calditrichaeota bacterium]|nr:hypothetical protein [Calditrichota bacterium]
LVEEARHLSLYMNQNHMQKLNRTSLIPIGSYLKNDSLITFHFGWGDLPYWGVFSTDGNTYYTIAYKKGEGAIILVIGLDGNEINRHPVLEYNPTSQGVYKNMLITLSMKSQTNKGNNRIIGIDNNGTKVLDYEINSYFQNYNSFAIDRNEGFLMFHIHSDDSITTIDILSGQPKAKLSLREAEKYLFGNDLETTKFILSVFERKNHAIMSTEHLNKLINLYNSFVIYPKKSNSVINSIINNSLYIINLSEFRKKYPDFRYH